MNERQTIDSDSEIDLKELFLILWAYKTFILFVCALAIFWGGHTAITTTKEFTSAAIFRLDQDKVGLDSMFGQLGNLSGITDSKSNSSSIKSQIYGRIFIEQINAELDFKQDRFFNTYNPNGIDPFWKANLKKLIGWNTYSSDPNEKVWQGIIRKYKEYVKLSENKSILKITVTHENADRAAEIANHIMYQIMTNQKNKINEKQNNQLEYLSSRLAEAITDLEKSGSNLKNFTINNSPAALVNFTKESTKLDLLREKFKKTNELYSAIFELDTVLDKNNLSNEDYYVLRQKHPIITQADFKRVLGQSEGLGAWEWPEKKTMIAILKALKERKKKLQLELVSTEAIAIESGLLLEEYARLKREEKVSEANYAVLMEHVKAQTNLAGFARDDSEIYEYASASTSASAPRRNHILLIYLISGLLISIILSIIFANLRGVFFSRRLLKARAQAPFNVNISVLWSLRRRNLSELSNVLTKKQLRTLSNISLEIHNSKAKYVIITALMPKLNSFDLAKSLGYCMQNKDTKIGIINFSQKQNILKFTDQMNSIGSFVVSQSEKEISILSSINNLSPTELLTQKKFTSNLDLIKKSFDLVFLCADNDDAFDLVRSIKDQKTYHLMLARTKFSKAEILSEVSLALPIQGLLHD